MRGTDETTDHAPPSTRRPPLPTPPYYAAIFSSQRSTGDHGYKRMAALMHDMALAQPGCLGAESARGDDGFGITVSYWTDEASLKAWKAVAAHTAAQRFGLTRWYDDYTVRIAKVERAYSAKSSVLHLADATPSPANGASL